MRKFLLAASITGLLVTGNAMAQADNTNSKEAPAMPSYQTWMHDSAMRNHGYISRQEYMDEMGRRWDAMDREQRGLTTAQINSMYVTPSHTTVQKGNSMTNPTGTERKGQSGG
jgi:hypothetical protein